jgi:hypothetical protein
MDTHTRCLLEALDGLNDLLLGMGICPHGVHFGVLRNKAVLVNRLPPLRLSSLISRVAYNADGDTQTLLLFHRLPELLLKKVTARSTSSSAGCPSWCTSSSGLFVCEGFSCPLNGVSDFYENGRPRWFPLLEKDGKYPN